MDNVYDFIYAAIMVSAIFGYGYLLARKIDKVA